MENIKRVKVFISCTSEIEAEIDIINLVIEDIIKTSGKKDGFTIESLNWNKDVYSSRGKEVQEVVNNQVEDYDLLIGILWKRAGTPTKKYKSGTIEEISRAIKNNKNALVYFNKQSPVDINEIDPEQLQIIKEFKKTLTNEGFLYKEYNSNKHFESLIKVDLYNIIHDRILNDKKLESQLETTEISVVDDKYSHVYDALNFDDNEIINDNFFDLIDKGHSQMEILEPCMNDISAIFEDFNENINIHSEKINVFNNISDNRARKSKIEKVIDDVTSLLKSFNASIEPKSFVFEETFPEFGNTYSSLSIILSNSESEDISEMKKAALSFKETVEFSLNSFVNLLKTLKTLPAFNRKFNEAKNETQLIIKKITKSMLDGLIILDNSKF